MSANNSSTEQNILKWLNGELSDADIKEKIGEESFVRYRQILLEVDHWQPDVDSRVFDPNIILQKKKAKRHFLMSWQSMSIAAGFLIFMIFGYMFFLGFETTYVTEFGQVKEILLPDGKSLAVLGPNSKLRLKKRHWRRNRHLSLDGKAFFKVDPGSSFIASTINGSIEVLGTEFEIVHFDKSLQVRCYEGKIRATSKNQNSTILKAGQSRLFHNGKWEKEISIVESAPLWIQNEAKFINAPISLVIKELSSTYQLNIDYDNVNLQRRFTGSFPTNNLEQSLQIVFGTLGIDYRLEGKNLILSE